MNILYAIIISPFEQLINICFNAAFSLTQNPGLSVVFLSIIVSTLILPLYIIAEKLQQAERDKQKQMQKMKEHIRAHAKGDKRYMLLSTLYRQNNYHPIYALRSSLGILIQVPFFIAAYQYLSALELFSGTSFAFIKDLSTPDGILESKGGGINILPILMTLLNVMSGFVYTKGLSRQDRIQVYALSALFLVLLYNSPSALVLYWTFNNIYNLVKNILLKNPKAKNIINLIFYDTWKYIFIFIKNKFNSFMHLNSKKGEAILLNTIVILAPNIFLFHMLSKNIEYVYYSHFLLLSAVFSAGSVFMRLCFTKIIKSHYASSLACVVLWTFFFLSRTLLKYFKYLDIGIGENIKKILVIALFALLTLLALVYGRRLKNILFYKILCIFLSITFLFNFFLSSVTYIQGKYVSNLDTNYKTSFIVNEDSQTPNIYWLFMDSMLGFKALEHYFNDPQEELKEQLLQRNFTINYDAELISGGTKHGIPALMSPYFFDNVMLPDSVQNPQNYLHKKENPYPNVSHTALFHARLNNELLNAFKAKNYNTVTIGEIGLYFMPTTTSFYYEGGRIEGGINNIKYIEKFDKLFNIIWLFYDSTPLNLVFKKKTIERFLLSYLKNSLNTNPLKESQIDKTKIYGVNYTETDKWHIDALTEIFESPSPRLIIVVDDKFHTPFILSNEGATIPRDERESFGNLDNYYPQHIYSRFYLMNLIDFILENDPDSIIIIQSDHGHDMDAFRNTILSSGGTPYEVRLICNQTMSAVRIPKKWGGLDMPLDPLNITRELVNRYVGYNYELIED